MSSKQKILRALRQAELPQTPLPPSNEQTLPPWITYDDKTTQFCRAVESVGGTAVLVQNVEGINQHLKQLEPFSTARKICWLAPWSYIDQAPPARPFIDLSTVDDPHSLQDVDFCLAPGQFAVAENGAVWVTDQDVKHRVIFFITQHLALVVPAPQILDNMHQAYERVSFDPSTGSAFGVFISGPSKTADIEQSLVIGAHGPRSLTVYLLENHEAP